MLRYFLYMYDFLYDCCMILIKHCFFVINQVNKKINDRYPVPITSPNKLDINMPLIHKCIIMIKSDIIDNSIAIIKYL